MSLQISFKERPIHRAPLEVLQHLYYYTTQYGLSVAQFTGAHQSYWEKLPLELRKAMDNPKVLNSIIIKLEKYAKGAEERLTKRREEKDRKWAQKEIIINAQLKSVLAAYPYELLSFGFRKLTGDRNLPNLLRIVDLVLRKEDRKEAFYFVDPDMLLIGDNHLLMVEIKTRGGANSSRNYPPSQLLNYFRLIAECQDSREETLPKQFSHLILVPSSDIKWLEKSQDWVIETRDHSGRLVVDPEGCIKAGRGKSSYNHERVKGLLAEFPIYYRSWEELAHSFDAAALEFNDKRNQNHWMRLSQELSELSNTAGMFK
jgi:hypothetical protein